MHSDWDLVHFDLPDYVFTAGEIKIRGQHYIVHFSSRSPTDNLYTDAIDVNVLPFKVEPPELICEYFWILIERSLGASESIRHY